MLLVLFILYILEIHFNHTSNMSLYPPFTSGTLNKKKDVSFSKIFSKAEPMFELAIKPQRSSFLILTLMSHWRAWGEAKWSLGPLAHSDVLFQTEQLLFSCQRGRDSRCVGVCLVTTNTLHVFIFLILFLPRFYRHRWMDISYFLHGYHQTRAYGMVCVCFCICLLLMYH